MDIVAHVEAVTVVVVVLEPVEVPDLEPSWIFVDSHDVVGDPGVVGLRIPSCHEFESSCDATFDADGFCLRVESRDDRASDVALGESLVVDEFEIEALFVRLDDFDK